MCGTEETISGMEGGVREVTMVKRYGKGCGEGQRCDSERGNTREHKEIRGGPSFIWEEKTGGIFRERVTS